MTKRRRSAILSSERFTMTKKMRENIRAIQKSVRENTPKVKRKLKKAGKKAHPALVHAAAKHYETLKKLAKE